MRIYIYYTDMKGYPFKIIPMFKVTDGISFDFQHLIVDSGVNRFFKIERRKEYPETYLEMYPVLAEKLTRKYGNKVWIVIPDYPDDYEHNRIQDNMRRTLRNVELMIDRKANWIVPIQAKWNDIEEFKEACREYRDLIGDYPRIAIGTLCTRSRKDYAIKCCKIARKFFPDSWIHVFGPNIAWLRHIAPYINSIDSVAYHYPPHGAKGRFREKVKENWIRIWLSKANGYLSVWKGQQKLF